MSIRTWITGIALAAMLLAPVSALAAPQCYQEFPGVFVMFNRPLSQTGDSAVNGRVWGALSSCDGLASWPIVGSSHFSATNGLVLAFRAFTVDATNCGAVDVIGTLSGSPSSGPFQLWNQRTNFGNTGTLTQISCPAPPAEPKGMLPGEVDVFGNSSK